MSMWDFLRHTRAGSDAGGPPPSLWWLHIPKCGTSFGETLKSFRAATDRPRSMHPSLPAADAPVELLSRTVAMFRLPEERLVSAHGYIRALEGRCCTADWGWPQEVFRSVHRAIVDNGASPSQSVANFTGCQTNMVLGHGCMSRHEYDGLSPEQVAARAIGRVRHFWFVGIVEEWELSMCLFNFLASGGREKWISPHQLAVVRSLGYLSPTERARLQARTGLLNRTSDNMPSAAGTGAKAPPALTDSSTLPFDETDHRLYDFVRARFWSEVRAFGLSHDSCPVLNETRRHGKKPSSPGAGRRLERSPTPGGNATLVEERSALAALERALKARWDRPPQSSVDLLQGSFGDWQPTRACASPKLFVFITGHYRTFHWTQTQMGRIASASSDDCYFAAAVMPEEICLRDAHAPSECAQYRYDFGRAPEPPLQWRRFASRIDDVPRLLGDAQRGAFGGRLAYMVLKRYGADYSSLRDTTHNRTSRSEKGSTYTYTAVYALAWHAVWLLCEHAARYHNMAPRDEAVVLRTRPDVAYTVTFGLSKLMAYFRLGSRGKHLLLGQETREGGQGDVQLITSYGCYSSDIALAIQRGLLHIGWANGKGYGWSMGTAQHLRPADGGVGCSNDTERPSCLATVVLSPHVVLGSDLVRGPEARLVRAVKDKLAAFITPRMIDLARRVHVYCPSKGVSFHQGGAVSLAAANGEKSQSAPLRYDLANLERKVRTPTGVEFYIVAREMDLDPQREDPIEWSPHGGWC